MKPITQVIAVVLLLSCVIFAAFIPSDHAQPVDPCDGLLAAAVRNCGDQGLDTFSCGSNGGRVSWRCKETAEPVQIITYQVTTPRGARIKIGHVSKVGESFTIADQDQKWKFEIVDIQVKDR